MSYEIVARPEAVSEVDPATLGLRLAAGGAPPPQVLPSPVGRIKARAQRDVVTVLFTDIEGFTRLAEALPLERTVDILAQYYEAILSVAAATGGTVDRFIGDGALVYFTRTGHGDHHADNAVESMCRLRQALSLQKGPRIAGGLPVRFGIHTGEAMVGTIGEGPLAKTLVGDVVNVASRLQQAAKALGSRPADCGLKGYVSCDTVRHLTALRPLAPYDRLALPGRKRIVLAHRM